MMEKVLISLAEDKTLQKPAYRPAAQLQQRRDLSRLRPLGNERISTNDFFIRAQYGWRSVSCRMA